MKPNETNVLTNKYFIMNVKIKFSCPWDIVLCENKEDAEKIMHLLKQERAKDDPELEIRELKYSYAIDNCVKARISDTTRMFVRFLERQDITVTRL